MALVTPTNVEPGYYSVRRLRCLLSCTSPTVHANSASSPQWDWKWVTVAVLCCWEGNRKSGITLAMCHSKLVANPLMGGKSSNGLSGLRKTSHLQSVQEWHPCVSCEHTALMWNNALLLALFPVPVVLERESDQMNFAGQSHLRITGISITWLCVHGQEHPEQSA